MKLLGNHFGDICRVGWY